MYSFSTHIMWTFLLPHLTFVFPNRKNTNGAVIIPHRTGFLFLYHLKALHQFAFLFSHKSNAVLETCSTWPAGIQGAGCWWWMEICAGVQNLNSDFPKFQLPFPDDKCSMNHPLHVFPCHLPFFPDRSAHCFFTAIKLFAHPLHTWNRLTGRARPPPHLACLQPASLLVRWSDWNDALGAHSQHACRLFSSLFWTGTSSLSSFRLPLCSLSLPTLPAYLPAPFLFVSLPCM